MADEPDNSELERQILGLGSAFADFRVALSTLRNELRTDFREIISARDELHTERFKGLTIRVDRLEDYNDTQRQELTDHHRTNRTLFWMVAGGILAAIATVVLTAWFSHGGAH